MNIKDMIENKLDLAKVHSAVDEAISSIENTVHIEYKYVVSFLSDILTKIEDHVKGENNE